MKKLLGILVLGLLWCNVGFAEGIYLKCTKSHYIKNSEIQISFVDEYFFDDKKFELHHLSKQTLETYNNKTKLTDNVPGNNEKYEINERIYKKYKVSETSYFFIKFLDVWNRKRSLEQAIEDNQKEERKTPYNYFELNKFTLELTNHVYQWKDFGTAEMDQTKIEYFSLTSSCLKLNRKI